MSNGNFPKWLTLKLVFLFHILAMTKDLMAIITQMFCQHTMMNALFLCVIQSYLTGLLFCVTLTTPFILNNLIYRTFD